MKLAQTKLLLGGGSPISQSQSSMAASISQLSCFSAINRSLQLQRRSLPCPSLRSKLSVVMSLEGHGTDTAGSDTPNSLSYTADVSKLHVDEKKKSHSNTAGDDAEKEGIGETVPEQGVSQQKRAAKIHDFCLGIPFGGFVLGGGIIGFLLSRSPATLSNGVLFGGVLLFLSTTSLKVWSQGKSSIPFILGQAALSAILVWKNLQAYSLVKRVFPSGFLTIISSAMLCFYLYVIVSGGNPPPKKLKSSASIASS